jgi:hypothetical protein
MIAQIHRFSKKLNQFQNSNSLKNFLLAYKIIREKQKIMKNLQSKKAKESIDS